MLLKNQTEYFTVSSRTGSTQNRVGHGVYSNGYTSRVDAKGNTYVSRQNKYNGEHDWITPGATGATTSNYAGKTVKENGFVYSKKNSDDEDAVHIATKTNYEINYTKISYRNSNDWEGIEVPTYFYVGTTSESTTDRFISTTSTWEETRTKEGDTEITYYSTKFTSTNFEKTFLSNNKTETSYQKTYLVTRESYLPTYIFTFMSLVRNKSITVYANKTTNVPMDDNLGTYIADPGYIFKIDYSQQASLWNNRGDICMHVTECVLKPAKLEIENRGAEGERVANTTKYGKDGAAAYRRYPRSTGDTFSAGGVVINLPESEARMHQWEKDLYDARNARAEQGGGEPDPPPPSIGQVTRENVVANWIRVRKTNPHQGNFKTIGSYETTVNAYDYDSTVLRYNPDEGTFDTFWYKSTSTASVKTSQSEIITNVSKIGYTVEGDLEYTMSTLAAWRTTKYKINSVDYTTQALQTQSYTLYKDHYYGHKFEENYGKNVRNGEGDLPVVKTKFASFNEDYIYRSIFPKFIAWHKVPESYCLVSSHYNNEKLLGSNVESYFKIDTKQSAAVGVASRGARAKHNEHRDHLRLYETDNQARYYITYTDQYNDHTRTMTSDALLKATQYQSWNLATLEQIKEVTQAQVFKNSNGNTVIKTIVHKVSEMETKSSSGTWSSPVRINAYNTINSTGSSTRSTMFFSWESAVSGTEKLKTLSLEETDYANLNHVGQFGQITAMGGINSENKPLQCHCQIFYHDEVAVMQTAIYTKYSTSIDWQDLPFTGSFSTEGSDITIVRKKPIFTASSTQGNTVLEISKGIENYAPIRHILRKPVIFSQKNTYTEIKQPNVQDASDASKVYSVGMGIEGENGVDVWNGEEFIDAYMYLEDN